MSNIVLAVLLGSLLGSAITVLAYTLPPWLCYRLALLRTKRAAGSLNGASAKETRDQADIARVLTFR